MEALKYINLLGQPVLLTGRKQKREVAHRGAHHDGWLAVGISPEALDTAKRKLDFDLQSFLRNAKPEKVRVQPYISSEVAHEACVLAERFGWMNCRVVEKRYE